MELGVDVAMSRSQNDTTGHQLLTQHFGRHPSGFHVEKAYFKPIQTDEEKLESDRVAHSHPDVLKPTPVIYVNDSELQLSPLTPPLGGGQLGNAVGRTTDGGTGISSSAFEDPEEEMRRIMANGRSHDTIVANGRSHDTGSEREERPDEPTTRHESINTLQRLQQQTKVPQLGGKVSRIGMVATFTQIGLPFHPCLPPFISPSLLPLSPPPSSPPPSLPPPSSPPPSSPLPRHPLPHHPLPHIPLPQFVSTLTPSRDHFVEGKRFNFRVTILQATGIPRDFTDIFVQFR